MRSTCNRKTRRLGLVVGLASAGLALGVMPLAASASEADFVSDAGAILESDAGVETADVTDVVGDDAVADALAADATLAADAAGVTMSADAAEAADAAAAAGIAAADASTADAAAAAAAGGPVLFGVKANSSSALRTSESHAGRKMAIVRDYDHWNTVFPSGWSTWLKQNNYTISLSLNPKVGGSTVSWRSIANAQPGSAIHQNMVNRARAMANFGDKIYFTFHHEPNQKINLRYGSASDFKAAYRKFSGILNAAGARNVIKVWTVTGSSFTASDWRAASAWYPGGDVVDVVGADGYNWYTCLPRGSTARRPWTSFASVFEPARRFSAAQGKQLLINEYGSTEDPRSPGRKGKWFVDAKNTIKSPGWGHLRALLYYESGSGNCNWHVGSSSSSIAGFRSFGGDQYMSGTL